MLAREQHSVILKYSFSEDVVTLDARHRFPRRIITAANRGFQMDPGPRLFKDQVRPQDSAVLLDGDPRRYSLPNVRFPVSTRKSRRAASGPKGPVFSYRGPFACHEDNIPLK